jgi:hypothetical protein
VSEVTVQVDLEAGNGQIILLEIEQEIENYKENQPC